MEIDKLKDLTDYILKLRDILKAFESVKDDESINVTLGISNGYEGRCIDNFKIGVDNKVAQGLISYYKEELNRSYSWQKYKEVVCTI